ncbi:membrane protein [Megasphaera cerevisiae DSM 20462]|mgnify:CR=1 FL=1|jgi:drug/metabolite transporter (DMT)-like permease|uniref:Membrane protein n=1 Tax=Megasphaera cerevisiae DSM 20462 TaxID=1122219 RepID=A0A0J6ZNR6_9FIRM|nr:DMT family transporter [Megasphaera cerevisiae]KMO86511.1 membrane protein [Megasphaera cerevisiae DSM 20462]MCI1749835.1 DMT family transporter [Megasphaera cerevisiae]SJZ91692.1 Permease of the drug/metabolite transporter (DMT) superfamily [Megasphaera cerevisiae DSM 20462]
MKYRLMLLGASLFWGGAFVAQRVSTDTIGPFAFNGLRFLLGAAAILPIVYWHHNINKTERPIHSCKLPLPAACLLLGFLLFAGASCQQIGMIYTTAGKAGFITSLYIVAVPLLGLLIKQPLRLSHVGGCVVSFAGLYVLAFHSDGQAINIGDLLELTGVLFWSLHILYISQCVRYFSGIDLALGQFVACGLYNLAAMLITNETLTLGAVLASAIPLLYCGILSSGAGFTLQILGQEKVPPTEASLLCSFEMIFSAAAGFLLLGELLTTRELIGCGLMAIGIFTAQIPSKVIFQLKKA